MTQQIFENIPFEVILQTSSLTILSSLSTDCLKLKISKKHRSSSQLTSCAQYQCTIQKSEITEKLHQYFESLKELNDYLRISDNVKIDWDKNIIDIIAKGPTKKSSYMLLAQFRLNKIQKFGGMDRQSSSEEWIDHLAGQIIDIIESKSRIKDRADTQKQFVSKQEMETAIQNIRKELLLQLQKTRQQINTLKQQQQSHKSIQPNSPTNLQPQPQLQSPKQSPKFPLSKQQQTALLPSTTQTQQQFQQIEKQIQQIKQINSNIIIIHNKYKHQLQQELLKIHENVRNQINSKFMEFIDVFSKKEEMDTVIRKIQSLGTKVENIMLEAEKKMESGDILQSKLIMQEKKLSQIQVKLSKDKQQLKPKQESPKKASVESSTPGNPIMVQDWIDKSCSHFGRISPNKSSITMNSYGNARIFSKIPIQKQPLFNLHIQKISKTIAIGVIDCTYKQSVIMGQQPNTIIYQNDRKFYNGLKEMDKKGEGFNTDDIITVVVDMELGTILWKVGNKLCFSWQSDLLRNRKIVWVPFVKMFDKGDQVELVE